MKIESVACDVCGISKRDTNHWFTAGDIGLGVLAISPWVTGAGDDICGEECLHKWISVNLRSLKEDHAEDQPTEHV